MTMDVLTFDGVSVVVPGVRRLDASLAESFRSALGQVQFLGSRALIVDLDSVNLVDSTILGVVVGIFRSLPEGSSLVLCTVGENVTSLLHLTHLDRILRVYPTREDALEALTH